MITKKVGKVEATITGREVFMMGNLVFCALGRILPRKNEHDASAGPEIKKQRLVVVETSKGSNRTS